MGEFILRAEPGADLYCCWSTIVDAPVFIGRRAHMIECLTEHRFVGDRCCAVPPEMADRMLARADEHGTSVGHCLGSGPLTGSWADEALIYQQEGFLPRAALGAVLRRFLDAPEGATSDPDVTDLLVPFEDDDPPEPTEYDPGPEVDDQGSTTLTLRRVHRSIEFDSHGACRG